MTQDRQPDPALLAEMVRANNDRCAYCQRRDGYTLSNPKVQVGPAVGGRPALVAHSNCDEPVQAWRRSRM